MTRMTSKAWMIGVVMTVMVVIDESNSLDTQSTIGNDFVFGVPSAYIYRHLYSKRVFLSSQRGETVNATVVTSGSNFRHDVTVPGDREISIDLPRSLTSRGTGLKQNVVGIRSDGDLSVHVQIEARVNSGAFTPLPTGSLGNDYIVGIYEPTKLKFTKYKAGFTVTATEAGARIQIRFSQSVAFGHVYYGPNDVFKFQLEAYESFQIMSDKDLTGSRVKSDNPVAVVAGSECSRVPKGDKYCDYLVEQMPPVHTLGKQFIVAPFRDRESSYVLRIIAPFNGTTILFSSPHADDINLDENQHHEFIFTHHDVLSFRSTKPVLVLQFMKGFAKDYVGDPSMVVIPPVEQFIVGELSLTSMDNDHVTVVVSNSNAGLSGLWLNGRHVGSVSPSWSVIAENGMSGVFQGTLRSGRHTIAHTDPQARLLVIGYGTGYLSGRAFPVAYNLKRLYVPSPEALYIPPTGYQVQCFNTSMSITLDPSVFLVHDPDHVTLNDPSCQPIINQGGFLVLSTPFDSCDTRVQEQGNTVAFTNTLWFAESVITPVSPLRELQFKCESAQTGIGISPLTGGQRQPSSLVLSDAILGDLSVSLVQYLDDTFGSNTGNASSGTDLWGTWNQGAPPGQNVFVVNVTSSVDASVFVDSCWTTQGPEAQDQESTTPLIQDGCEIDDTIHIGASADDPRFRPIAIDSFSAIGEYNEVFMHCRVQVCRGQDSAAHCWQECRREPRKRRDISGIREMVIVSTGPIKTK
ncbi:uncharacterized protein LOC129279613 [Lytechinus pictus]|uniref:uncharacterized protein LOC129279613 n=1 Tax=Lytechinus pictus TaxID=7653 RepID=UPI0030BA20A5